MKFVQVIKFDSTEKDEEISRRLNNKLRRMVKEGCQINNIIYRDTTVSNKVQYCCFIEYEG